MAVAGTRPPFLFARPLDELPGGSLRRCAALDSGRAPPARLSPRPPATPAAGPPECEVCSGRLDRRASRCARWHVGRGAAGPRDRGRAARRVRRASGAVTPSAVTRALCVAVAARCPGWAHRDPPNCAPVLDEGDLWGDLQCGGPGNRLTVSPVGDRLNSHPTPRPPQGGSEESEQKDQFSAAQGGMRLVLP
jgi:hypothetical protein